MNCDKYGWSMFSPTDEVKPFDGTIDTGIYFIETDCYFPLKGNGWYFDGVVEKALKYKLIGKSKIKYQVLASIKLKREHFKQFINEVYDKFDPSLSNGGKHAINGFIGLLGRSTAKSKQHHFETNYDVVAGELVNNANVNIKGIYKDTQQTDTFNQVNLLNLNDDELGDEIDRVADTTSEPVLYQLTQNNEMPNYTNTLPIHRKVYGVANMEMFELHLKIQNLNPHCELVGIKTDCLVYNNIDTDIETSNAWGDVKKCDVPLIKEITINQEPKIRTETYVPTYESWNIKTWNPDENGYINKKGYAMDKNLSSYIEQGYLTLGMAGTGKSEVLKESQLILQKNAAIQLFTTACPTHKACKFVNGKPYIEPSRSTPLTTHMNITKHKN